MRLFLVLIGVAMISTAATAAPDERFQHTLKLLEPTDRLEQLCNYTAMNDIKKDPRRFRPDRAVAGARQEPRIKGHTIVANGAAFRSRKKWYALSYSCTADAEHLKVLSFTFKVGEEIPESKWAAFNLWQ